MYSLLCHPLSPVSPSICTPRRPSNHAESYFCHCFVLQSHGERRNLRVVLAIAIIVISCRRRIHRLAEEFYQTAKKGKEQMQPSSLFFTAAKPLAPSLRVKAARHTVTDPDLMSAAGVTGPKWAQKTVTLPRHSRGCHLVTRKIVKEIEQDLSQFKCGLAHFFLHHTSASLTINENYDSDVREDTETFLNRIVPEGRSAPWKHTLEGPDDMPAHIKSSMFGCSLTIPITDGKLNMGQWQGIWLCEHRDLATPRSIVVTLNGI